MRTLKDLTKEECVKIASISEPNIEWEFLENIDNKYKWNGFDIVDKDFTNIFQIDYRFEDELEGKSRFRFYHNLNEYSAKNIGLIFDYLKSIDIVTLN